MDYDSALPDGTKSLTELMLIIHSDISLRSPEGNFTGSNLIYLYLSLTMINLRLQLYLPRAVECAYIFLYGNVPRKWLL